MTVSSGAAAPKPPQDAEHDEGLDAFVAAYPKRRRNDTTLVKAWQEARRTRSAKVLLAALARAKGSKAWQEEDGRYIPRPEVWLSERGYEAFLSADERLTADERKVKVLGGLDAFLTSMARSGFEEAELKRIRAKATPLVVLGWTPEQAIDRAFAELDVSAD